MSYYSKILGKEVENLKSELEHGKRVNWVMSSPFGRRNLIMPLITCRIILKTLIQLCRKLSRVLTLT